MGKVIPIRLDGKHTEKFFPLKTSVTDYLAQELAEIIEELEGNPDGFFRLTIVAGGYPQELLDRIQKLLDA